MNQNLEISHCIYDKFLMDLRSISEVYNISFKRNHVWIEARHVDKTLYAFDWKIYMVNRIMCGYNDALNDGE